MISSSVRLASLRVTAWERRLERGLGDIDESVSEQEGVYCKPTARGYVGSVLEQTG